MASGPDLSALNSQIVQTYGEDPSGLAKQLGLDPNLFLSLINTESSGNNDAKSSSGAIGFTQLTPAAVSDLKTKLGTPIDPTDPYENLYGGAKWLQYLLQQTGNTYDALRAYNAGLAGAAADPKAGADYAATIMQNAGLQLPEGVTAPSSASSSLIDFSGFWSSLVDTLKSYGIKAVVWAVIALLVLFGIWRLVNQDMPIPPSSSAPGGAG